MEKSETIPPNHFICECCGGIFEKAWTDQESKAKAAETFGRLSKDDDVIVCEICYTDIMNKWSRLQ